MLAGTLVAAACAAAACGGRRPSPADAPPAPPLVERPLPPTMTPGLETPAPRQTRSADGREVLVEGAVRNRGTKPVRDVEVLVRGLDATGAVVIETRATPMPQLLPPGGEARYFVRVPDHPTVRTYGATAIGR